METEKVKEIVDNSHPGWDIRAITTSDDVTVVVIASGPRMLTLGIEDGEIEWESE